jgi:indole-3-glycerol phosphate synthase
MKNILQEIIAQKRVEVEASRQNMSIESLMASSLYNRTSLSLVKALKAAGSSGIIAECKRKSPSKGWINQSADAVIVAQGYRDAGAAGISVLTDTIFFGGVLEDLKNVRMAVELPLLRKDFIIDTYQLYEAKAFGADVVLLIAAALQKDEVNRLACKARELGLEVLLEIHNKEELEFVNQYVNIVGVNNRSLETFVVDVETSKKLAASIPPGITKISESGITSPTVVSELRKSGYSGFLMGELFMKESNPWEELASFIATNRNMQ